MNNLDLELGFQIVEYDHIRNVYFNDTGCLVSFGEQVKIKANNKLKLYSFNDLLTFTSKDQTSCNSYQAFKDSPTRFVLQLPNELQHKQLQIKQKIHDQQQQIQAQEQQLQTQRHELNGFIVVGGIAITIIVIFAVIIFELKRANYEQPKH